MQTHPADTSRYNIHVFAPRCVISLAPRSSSLGPQASSPSEFDMSPLNVPTPMPPICATRPTPFANPRCRAVIVRFVPFAAAVTVVKLTRPPHLYKYAHPVYNVRLPLRRSRSYIHTVYTTHRCLVLLLASHAFETPMASSYLLCTYISLGFYYQYLSPH